MIAVALDLVIAIALVTALAFPNRLDLDSDFATAIALVTALAFPNRLDLDLATPVAPLPSVPPRAGRALLRALRESWTDEPQNDEGGQPKPPPFEGVPEGR